MESKEITDILAKKICNKKVIITNSRTSFFQDISKIVVPNSWVEALHEIAHWLACDPKYRNERNLALIEPDDNTPVEIATRIYSEECVALSLTKLLYYKFYNVTENEDKEQKYIDYLGNNTIWFKEEDVPFDHHLEAQKILDSIPDDILQK